MIIYKSHKVSIGDRREKIKFAFLPVWISGDLVWLEKYRVIQQYREVDDYCCGWDTVTKSRLFKNKFMTKNMTKGEIMDFISEYSIGLERFNIKTRTVDLDKDHILSFTMTGYDIAEEHNLLAVNVTPQFLEGLLRECASRIIQKSLINHYKQLKTNK